MRHHTASGLLAAAILAAQAGGAAADSATPWTGFYVGLHVGAFWGDAAYDEPEYPEDDFSGDMGGLAGGLYAGYAWQLGDAVLGLEADGGAVGASLAADWPSNDYTELNLNWNAHLRAKAGWSFGQWQVFAAGGLALGRVEIEDSDSGWGSVDQTQVGWSVGGGLEVAVTPALRFRVEYLYDDYGDQSGAIANAAGDFAYKVHADLTGQTLRAGLAWQF
jgi:outer membrane immunogenic protein